MDKPEIRQHGSGQGPGRGLEPLAFGRVDQRGREQHGRQEKALAQGKNPVQGQITRAELGGRLIEAAPSHPQGGLNVQQQPGGQGRDETERHAQEVQARHIPVSLRRNDHADPKQDADHGLHGHHLQHQAHPAAQAQHRDHKTVQQAVAPACAHGFPAGMADVDGGGKRRAQRRRGQATQAVGQQRRPRGKTVPRGFGALQVLQAADDVEEAHGQDHAQVAEPILLGQKLHRAPTLLWGRRRARRTGSTLGWK